MLGCQDFCGYYDWTFAFVRSRFGQHAVAALWAEAIAGESQRHYADAGAARGLRGLYDTWNKTGQDEHCDWTFTLDEGRNVLRWDMRSCPSKGFLIHNDLQADEDYCDHCMGWMVPLLDRIGVEVVAHEHNHCGQCWGEMRMKGRPTDPLDLPIDIRKDARWGHGYVDRFSANSKLPLLANSSADPCQVLRDWFSPPRTPTTIVTGDQYAEGVGGTVSPSGVVIGQSAAALPRLVTRFDAAAPAARPLLMHTFLPGLPPIDFLAASLPRPVPILPLLLRAGVYVHRPKAPAPTTEEFVTLLVQALQASRDHTPSSEGP